MNTHSIYDQETYWEPVPHIVFYEPRTIPPAWDLSELLPAVHKDCYEPLLPKEDPKDQ